MKTVLKWLLIGLLVAGIVAGVVFAVLAMEWPWWVGLGIMIGLVGVVLLFFFVRKWLFRKDEKAFIKHVTADDEAQLPSGKDQRSIDVLEQRWNEAIAALRRSHLKRKGKPLYVLPWYLFLGEAGSGKTSAIKSSRLHSALTDVSQSSPEEGTKNCDWWFFDKAVILDTAGRYAMFQDEILDKAEWQQFLLLLVRHRRREPINGLVITISADKLVNEAPDTVADDGRRLRRRLDELMRAFGARLPVYVMVTKMDQVPGFTSWCDLLTDEETSQAFGSINSKFDVTPTEIVEDVFDKVGVQLRQIRLRMAVDHEEFGPELLLLPTQLEKIHAGTAHFVSSLFEKNPYQESPMMRGFFFSSSRQDPLTHAALPNLPAPSSQADGASTSFRGLFLRDFFSKILPVDRYLSTPIAEYLRWQKWTRNIGLLAELAIIVFLAVLLSLSFINNNSTISAFTNDFDRTPQRSDSVFDNVTLLEKFEKHLNKLEQLNEGWILPRMGLNQSEIMEEKLKNEYVRLFRDWIVDPLDKGIHRTIASFTSDITGEQIAAFVEHLGTRVGLLTQKLDENELSALEELPQTTFTGVSKVSTDLLPERAARLILPHYSTYIRWNKDKQVLEKERTGLQDALKHLALSEGTTLNWLVRWTNLQDARPVRLKDFWDDVLGMHQNAMVQPAFTLQGRKLISEFISTIEKAVDDPEVLKKRRLQFENYYRRAYVDSWRQLGLRFDPVRFEVESRTDRRRVAEILTEPANPYLALLTRMSKELSFLAEDQKATSWVRGVSKFEKVKAWADKPGLRKGVAGAEKAVSALDKKGISNGKLSNVELIAKEGDYLNAYRKSLAGFAALANSSIAAFKMISQLFRDSATSPISNAYKAWGRLRRLHPSNKKDDLYVALLSGPLRFLVTFAIREAATELQSQWDSTVLAEIADVPKTQHRKALCDPADGAVWRFHKGPAASFVKREAGGAYQARRALGIRFPIRPGFLSFLKQCKEQEAGEKFLSKIQVVFRTVPTIVNPNALSEVESTTLTMECTDNPQKLENHHFPARANFVWEREKCSDVELQIRFRDFTVVRRWPGANGFPNFLQEFRTGLKIYTPKDFADKKSLFRQRKIKTIRIEYKVAIKGNVKPSDLKKTVRPLKIPKAIVKKLPTLARF